jgi:3-dehydroquinate synthase
MSNIIDVRISFKQQYQIVIGEQLQQPFQSFCNEQYSGKQIFVLVDEKVHNLHQEKIAQLVSSFEKSHFIEIPEGESSKSVAQWNKITDELLTIGVERTTPLLAVGGGVTGDLAGFVASTVLRGIPLIHMPTSLLAMVDSSIGGKTGVNHSTGKNLIGAFYQPDAVFSDIAFLETLEQKEWITGIAEILKYAAIRNPELFEEVENLHNQPFKPKESWAKIIGESARIKTGIVEEDALEAGKRAYLNFGHTFGHALEKVAGYGNISHGEAVFVGMLAATFFSSKQSHSIDNTRFDPFIPLYKQQMSMLPQDVGQLIDVMKTDKKVKDNTLRLVLLNDWGSPYIYECSDHSKLYDAWEYALSQFN